MYKIEELEKKWFKYKLKKILTPFLSFLALLSIVIGGYYFYTIKKASISSLNFSEIFSSKVTTPISNDDEINISKIETKLAVNENKNEVIIVTPKVESIREVLLTPIIPVIDMDKEERISDVKRARPKRTQSKNSTKLVEAKPNAYLTPKELSAIGKRDKNIKTEPHKTKKMNFQTTTINYIDTMKRKFYKSNNSREALLLAKYYYKNKNYKESESWALSANKLNNSLEESWLIFAKSKVKLGKKKEALKILVSYYKKSHSAKAKRLIGQIKTGKL